MSRLLVVDRVEDWPVELPGAQVVEAREYLTDPRYSTSRRLKVFNLCRSYRYQSLGYYVSLLAAARDHRPLPSVATIQDLKSPATVRSVVRFVSEDLEELIGRTLKPLAGDQFTLSIYFGRNLARRYHRLALRLFNAFPAPLLRARFDRDRSAREGAQGWRLTSLRPIATREVPAEHWDFVLEAATAYFSGRQRSAPKPAAARYDLAVLVNPEESDPPSDAKALQRFSRAARALGLAVDLLTPDDLGRISEYDALFLRETTRVDHHTYRFARRAATEGLVVIDDPDSILRCTNKVFLAERLTRAGIPTPRTEVIHSGNLREAGERLGFPCVLKVPDGAFSTGVFRAGSAAELEELAGQLLVESDLLIAQEFVPTPFDWRIGVLDRKPLYACRYHMAPGHWQIVQRDRAGRRRYGRVEAVPLEGVPPGVVETALAAAAQIGDGLYGVDLKELEGQAMVIEVNDNPSLESDIEDAVLGDELWRTLARSFLDRLERTRRAAWAESAPQGSPHDVPAGSTAEVEPALGGRP